MPLYSGRTVPKRADPFYAYDNGYYSQKTTNYLHFGFNQTYTPTTTGKLRVTFVFLTWINGVGDWNECQARYGTGAAPAQDAAVTGTQLGDNYYVQDNDGTLQIAPLVIQDILTGLTVGTAYWFDIVTKSTAGVTESAISDVSVIIEELE